MEIKLVGVPLSVDLGHDVFVIVVSESAAEFVVVHVGLAFPLAPSSSHFVGVNEFEFSVGSFPGNARYVGAVGQELE